MGSAGRKGSKLEGTELVDARRLDLDEWLEALAEDPNHLFPHNAFPTGEHREAYVASVASRDEAEVRRLIRAFVVHSSTYGHDDYNMQLR